MREAVKAINGSYQGREIGLMVLWPGRIEVCYQPPNRKQYGGVVFLNLEGLN